MAKGTIDDLLGLPENPWVAQVRRFHNEKLAAYAENNDTPHLLSAEKMLYHAGSISQEWSEILEAAAVNDLTKVADGIADTIYTLLGLANEMGLPITAIFADVHRSNMDKDPAGPGTMGRKTADGKSMKPAGWIAPRIYDIIAADTVRKSQLDMFEEGRQAC